MPNACTQVRSVHRLHVRPQLMSSCRPKDGMQAHKATRMIRALDLEDGEADGRGLEPCQLGAELYELALVTLMRVQGMCHSSSSLSKWALELLHDQGWKVAPPPPPPLGCWHAEAVAGMRCNMCPGCGGCSTAAPAEQLICGLWTRMQPTQGGGPAVTHRTPQPALSIAGRAVT